MSARVPTAARVPVIVRERRRGRACKSRSVRPRGASVRNYHCEPEAHRDEPAGATPRFDITAAGETHQGLRRSSNEDAMLVLEEQFRSSSSQTGWAAMPAARLRASSRSTRWHPRSSRKTAAPWRPVERSPPRALELVQGIAAANEAVRSAAAKAPQLLRHGHDRRRRALRCEEGTALRRSRRRQPLLPAPRRRAQADHAGRHDGRALV